MVPLWRLLWALVLAALILGAELPGTLAAKKAKKAKRTPARSPSRFSLFHRRSPSPLPGSQLFHTGEDALSWSSDDLDRIRMLHTRDFSDKDEYIHSANLAAYLGVAELEALHMPVPLNFVFVGFSGDGNHRIDYSQADLLEWFAHLDHILPHTRVALSDLTCSTDGERRDGHCVGQGLGSTLLPSPLGSYVHLNLSCNVIDIQPGRVMDTFERAIAAFSRPVDPELETGEQQVDALKMDAFVEHFLDSLGLSHTYTILVINPRWSTAKPSYGYRVGFSEQELLLLQGKYAKLSTLMAQHPDPEPEVPRSWNTDAQSFHHDKRSVLNVVTKLGVEDLRIASSQWADNVAHYLTQEERHRQALLHSVKSTNGQAAQARAIRLLKQRHTELGRLLHEELLAPLPAPDVRKFHTKHPLEDCLVPNWVGQGRWLMLDLTAGGSLDWGPALGGEGIVTHQSLPSVTETFGDLQDKRDEARAQIPAHAEDMEAAHQELDAARARRRAKLSHHYQYVQRAQRLRGGSPDDRDADAKPGHKAEESGTELDEKFEQSLLQAELDLYHELGDKQCRGLPNPPAICRELRHRAEQLKHELDAMASSSGSTVPQHPHGWDIFGAIDDDDIPELVLEGFRVKDNFMAQLSAVLSSGLRHVIAPPTATWHHDGYLHDTASPFARRVHFDIFLVSDVAHGLLQGASNRSSAHFDQALFEREVTSLKLPGQHFGFSTRRMVLSDDVRLAVAFSAALRTSFAEVPHADADPEDNAHRWLDSKALAYRLRKALRALSPGRRDRHRILDVPVIVFQLARASPILIDEHYNAKALEDMVLVVQNQAHLDEHPTGMMCQGGLLSRPMSPMKGALTAVLQHLGGVLPPHLGYSPRRGVVTHDWLWSVGAHPLSMTSSGARYSQLHRDALHRSYILDAVDSSVEAANAAVALLVAEKPTEQGYQHVLEAQGLLRQALREYGNLVEQWRSIMEQSLAMDLDSAATSIPELELLTQQLAVTCEAVHERLHPRKCAARTELPKRVIAMLLGGSSVVTVAGLLVAFMPKFKKKPKFN